MLEVVEARCIPEAHSWPSKPSSIECFATTTQPVLRNGGVRHRQCTEALTSSGIVRGVFVDLSRTRGANGIFQSRASERNREEDT